MIRSVLLSKELLFIILIMPFADIKMVKAIPCSHTNRPVFKTILSTTRSHNTNYHLSNENLFLKMSVIDDDDKPKMSMAEENDGPRVSVKSIDEIMSSKPKPYQPSSSSSSVKSTTEMNKDVVTRKTATFGSLSVEDLKGRMIQKDAIQKDAFANRKKEDLNGIQPMTPLFFSIFPAIFSYGMWQLTVYFTGHFAIDLAGSDIYPVQRLAVISRNLVVGMTTLASGFTGVISLGLFLLGVTVSIGVLKGELDPNNPKPPTSPPNEST